MTVSQDYRAESRSRWARNAPGWEAHADEQHRATMPVSAWMVDALEPQPGEDVLELAAGTGDTGFLAAELIRPGGTLICSDFAPQMLAAAQRRAQRLGLRNVRFKQIDAETAIDLEAASQDGVLCRWGYMLMADPESALRETRRVLRPGRRVALAAWTAPQDNPWTVLPARELTLRGLLEQQDPDAPGQFAWAREGVIADALAAGGFTDVLVDTVAFAYRYPSVEAWWATARAFNARAADAAASLTPDAEAELLAALAAGARPFTQDDGTLALPARTWVAAASA